MISSEDVKEDIARNLEQKKGRKMKAGENDDRDLLYRLDLKLSLEPDIKPKVCPTTKLAIMQNRQFGEANPFIESYSWELEKKDLQAKVDKKVEEREKQENRDKEKKQASRGSKKRSAFNSPGGKSRQMSPNKFSGAKFGSNRDSATKSGIEQPVL